MENPLSLPAGSGAMRDSQFEIDQKTLLRSPLKKASPRGKLILESNPVAYSVQFSSVA